MRNNNQSKIKSLILLLLLICCSCTNADTPPITPAWALGHYVWEDSLNTQDGVIKLVDNYISRNIPVHGVIIDSPWSTSYNDFIWDVTRYPEPNKLIIELAKRNVKPILWMTGAVNTECTDVPVSYCETFEYVVDNGYAVNGGQPFSWWKGKGVHIDFTNDVAKQWWFSQLDKVFDGFYGFKVDGAEVGLGEPVSTSIGDMSNQEFRYYYYDAMYDYVTSRKPDTGIIYARPYSYQGPGNYANPNKLSIGWCGDFDGDYAGLKKQIENIYQSAINGYCAVGCETGGFFGPKSSAEELIRYIQFASMTACMINGGSNGPFSNHLPWWHGDWYAQIYKYYVSLHMELVPYIFSSIVDCHLYGGTLLKNCSLKEMSHFLGDNIFAKAIFSNDEISFTLPEGYDYFDFFTDERYKGGTVIDYPSNLEKYPLFVKSGSIIPLNIDNDYTGIGDDTMKGARVITIYPSANVEKMIHWPTGDGVEYEDVNVKYFEDGQIKVTSDNDISYVLLIHNADSIKDVYGASKWEYDNEKRILRIYARGTKLNIKIDNGATSIRGVIRNKSNMSHDTFYGIDGKQSYNITKGLYIVKKKDGSIIKTVR